MKKASKSHHHSLNELNITPLLDLAFVLLVIFILTTAPPVNTMDLNLPSAKAQPKEPPKKPVYVSVDAKGQIAVNRQNVDLTGLGQLMVQLRSTDPDLSVVVRGDSRIQYQNIMSVLDVLHDCNVIKVGLATEAQAGN
jgi:biopolymer transport protein ExbD